MTDTWWRAPRVAIQIGCLGTSIIHDAMRPTG